MLPIYAIRIREIRQKLGLTQPEFAQKIGTTKNQLSKYELNINEVPARIILTICEEFQVSANWMYGQEESTYSAKDLEVLRARRIAGLKPATATTGRKHKYEIK